MHGKTDPGVPVRSDCVKKGTTTIWGRIEKMTVSICFTLCRRLGREPSKTVSDTVVQFIRFGLVGVSNTILSYLLYVLTLYGIQTWKSGTGENYDYLAAQTVAFVLSVLWSYYWNRKMVFVADKSEQGPVWRSLARTFVSYSLTGLFLSSILLLFWVRVLGISEYMAPVLNLLLTVPANFILHKFWAFREN